MHLIGDWLLRVDDTANTPEVCRKCCVHPAVLECYFAGKLERRNRRKVEEATNEDLREAEEDALRKEEPAVVELLQSAIVQRVALIQDLKHI
jgi:DNA topoisomerase-1